MGALAAAIGFLAEHADLFDLIFNLITSGKATKAQLIKSIEDSATLASDAEMRREFPNG